MGNGNSRAEWRAARSEALVMLQDALAWNLPVTDWEQVQNAVTDMAIAVATTSLDALWQTVSRLEFCSPLRVATRVGDTPPLPAPKAVRDRVTELIATLAREGGLEPADEPCLESGNSIAENLDASQTSPSAQYDRLPDGR